MRILASDLFSKSHRLSAFLKFICDQHSRGFADTINEQRIGTEVFGRPPGYHVGEDSIVRSQARFLRQRLEEYFTAEGRNEPIVLSIPKGSYVPAYERREVRNAAAEPLLAPHPMPVPQSSPVLVAAGAKPPKDSSKDLTRYRLLLGASLAATLILAALLFRAHAAERQKTAEVPAARAFWGSIFNPERTVLIVPADSTLVLMEGLTGKPVRLLSYINKDYLNSNPPEHMLEWNMLVGSQYTNMADLNLVDRLERVPEAANSRAQIRYARDLSLKELKGGNSILIGGLRANPWVELFASTLTFDVDYDWTTQHNVVRNRAPGPNEQAVYIEETKGLDDGHAYGVVAYMPSLDNQGHALLVEGTSKAGTEAAAEFLTGPGFAQFLQQIGATGTTVPYFELLLSTGSMDGASYHPAVVCWHPLRKNSSS
jgi:hypothetical protein